MKSKQPRKRRATTPKKEVRCTWAESRTFCGPYPKEYKRFYQLETLKSAVEKALIEQDRFVYAGLQTEVGTAPISSCTWDLVYEDAVRLVFLVQVATQTRKRATLRVVVAKNHQECSAKLLREYEMLTLLHQRAPTRVVAPCHHGVVFLPDRHRRRDMNREVFAYMTKDVPGAAPLYVASNTQLAFHDPRPRRFSKKDTDAIKKAMTTLLVALYDEERHHGLDPAALYPECLAVTPTQGASTLVLMHCPRLRKHLSATTLLHHILYGVFKTDDAILPLAPAYPEDFFAALCDGASPETARTWCRAFLAKAGAMEAHAHEELLPGRDYLAVLKELTETVA